MEKINIAELLKDCPDGMKLDCTMYNGLEFDRFDEYSNPNYPIVCRVKNEFGQYNFHTFTKYGGYSRESYSKCVIFPKGKTTWEGFVPPCKFKDGDVVTNQSSMGTWIGIYHKHDYIDETFSSYMSIRRDGKFCPNPICGHGYYETRLATEEEKQKLFAAIKENGYKWNPKTKTLEKLPKFKVGDRIVKRNSVRFPGRNSWIVVSINSKFYEIKLSEGIGSTGVIPISEQDDWKLVPSKFDISNLVPFESRVLVRDDDNRIWIPTFWGKHLENDSNYSYLTTNGFYKYCIPYENNEHLLGTTNDCDDFYKTWE